MESTNKIGMAEKKEAVTYIFASEQEKTMSSSAGLVPSKLRQIVPVVCASLSCLPFGLMLGWPSPIYPTLLESDSIIPITIDQSAVIAAFLLIGTTLGTPISRKCFMESKYGILLGMTFMTTGWFLMWQARNIFWLFGSRLLVGLGNGYCTGQLKIYIDELCDDSLKPTLTKLINLYVFLGVAIVFSFGPFLPFRQTSIVSLSVAIIVFFLLLFLPSTPKELVKAKQYEQALRLISYLKPGANINDEVNKIASGMNVSKKEFGLWRVVTHRVLRKRFVIFAFLVFCQQFSGVPATIIYTQILFDKSGCPNAEYLAIAYAVIYLFANIIGVFLSPKFDKRNVLLLSTFGVVLMIAAKLCVLFFKLNETYWSYSSVPVMYLYLVVHTVGLGSIPVTLIADFFAKEYRTSMTHFFIMFHSMLGVAITKIFQVVIAQYNVAVSFCLFLVVSVVAFVFIYFVLPKKTEPTQSINDVFVKNQL